MQEYFKALFVAAYRQIADMLSVPMPSVYQREEEYNLIAFGVKTLIKQHHITSGRTAVTLFLDLAYAGKLEDIKPQIPREVVEKSIEHVLEDHPNIWGLACRELGLSAS